MMVTTFTGSKLVDRSGRRPLLLIGFVGMAAGMLALGFIVRTAPLEPGTAKWMGFVCILVFTAFFGLGPAAAYRVVITEIFPTSVRGRAGSICAVANNLGNLAVAASFLTLSQAIGTAGTLWLYGAAGLSAWAFVYFLFPETKGRTLEEIAASWQEEGRSMTGFLKPEDNRYPQRG